MATPNNKYYKGVQDLREDLVGGIITAGEDVFSVKAATRGLISKNQLDTERSSEDDGRKASLVVAAIADNVRNDPEGDRVFSAFLKLLDETPSMENLANLLRRKVGMPLPKVQQRRPSSEMPNLEPFEGSGVSFGIGGEPHSSNESDHSTSSTKKQVAKEQPASMDVPAVDSSNYLRHFTQLGGGSGPVVTLHESSVRQPANDTTCVVGNLPVLSNTSQGEVHEKDREIEDLKRQNSLLKDSLDGAMAARDQSDVDCHYAHREVEEINSELKQVKREKDKLIVRVAQKEKEIQQVEMERDSQVKALERSANRRSMELNALLETSKDEVQKYQTEICELQHENERVKKEYNLKIDDLTQMLLDLQIRKAEAEKQVALLEAELRHKQELIKNDSEKHELSLKCSTLERENAEKEAAVELAKLEADNIKLNAQLTVEQERNNNQGLLEQKDREIERLQRLHSNPRVSFRGGQRGAFAPPS